MQHFKQHYICFVFCLSQVIGAVAMGASQSETIQECKAFTARGKNGVYNGLLATENVGVCESSLKTCRNQQKVVAAAIEAAKGACQTKSQAAVRALENYAKCVRYMDEFCYEKSVGGLRQLIAAAKNPDFLMYGLEKTAETCDFKIEEIAHEQHGALEKFTAAMKTVCSN